MAARPRFILSHLWPLHLYRVAGHSMQPTYQPGNTLLGWRWWRPRVGQVVVAHRAGELVIKRLAQLTPEGAWLTGDNSGDSQDSRHYGVIPFDQLEAVIMKRLT